MASRKYSGITRFFCWQGIHTDGRTTRRAKLISGFIFASLVQCWFPTFNAKQCWAGASASQWVIVVNGDSVSSRTIANHFAQIRDIPAANIIVLGDVPNQNQITLEEFKDLILVPVLEQIQTRRLSNHIQGIAYSTDFPTAVSVADDVAKIPNRPRHLTPVASINGLTYFYRHILANSPNYLSYEANNYASRPGGSLLKPLFVTQERKKEFESLLADEEWSSAAELLASERKTLPSELRPAMRVIEAQIQVRANELDAAEQSLKEAVAEGWQFKTAISTAEFEPLKDRPEMIATLSRCADTPFDYTPFRGFDARACYTANSLSCNDNRLGVNYMLSVVLGVARDFGITRFEVVQSLKRSAKSDYQGVEGTFLFSKTNDVRTTTRASHFPATIERLRMKGFEAKMIPTALPQRREQVAGLMVGAPNLSIATSGVELMPGAIADNLTSYGGAMTSSSQTKATEFLRHGAAGSSGTVYEPYTIINKFPHPMIHDAYTDGLTLAEAFYSNVLAPYQLLIVGDPLCQPFAAPPRFEVNAESVLVSKSDALRLNITSNDDGQDIKSLTLSIDGTHVGEIAFKPQIALDLTNIPQGWHELRIIAKSNDPIESRFEQKLEFQVQDEKEKYGNLQWKCDEPKQKANRVLVPFEVTGQYPDQELEIWNNHEFYRSVAPGLNEFELDYKVVGNGPVRLQLRQRMDGKRSVASNIETVQHH